MNSLANSRATDVGERLIREIDKKDKECHGFRKYLAQNLKKEHGGWYRTKMYTNNAVLKFQILNIHKKSSYLLTHIIKPDNIKKFLI